MNVRFMHFEPEHLIALELQPSQRVEVGLLHEGYSIEEARDIAARGPAWSAIAGDGRVLTCGGFAETFPGVQAVAWALLAGDLGGHAGAISRYARARVVEQRYRRLETITAARPECIRWAQFLGFEKDPYPLRNFGAASELCFLFERIYHGPR